MNWRGNSNDDEVQITRWVGDRADETVRLPGNAEFSGSLSDLHVFFCSHFFYCTHKNVHLLYISYRRTIYSVVCTFESRSKLSAFVYTASGLVC